MLIGNPKRGKSLSFITLSVHLTFHGLSKKPTIPIKNSKKRHSRLSYAVSFFNVFLIHRPIAGAFLSLRSDLRAADPPIVLRGVQIVEEAVLPLHRQNLSLVGLEDAAPAPVSRRGP